MKLSIEKALQHGIAAHREGRLEEAEQLYNAILMESPNHPDANHNLGVLKSTVGDRSTALPLFQAALSANPQVMQFWWSYLEALISETQFEQAKKLLEEAEEAGLPEDKLLTFREKIPAVPAPLAKNTVRGPSLSKTRLDARNKKKNRKTQTSLTQPSQAQIKTLIAHYQADQLAEGRQLADALTKSFPRHPLAFKLLGAILKRMGKLSESLGPTLRCTELTPEDHTAHNNLGVIQKELGEFENAEASFRRALFIQPKLAETHNNLGNLYRELGRLNESEESYRQALLLNPDYAKAHNNLGLTLQDLGELDSAEASFRLAIGRNSEYAEAYNNLGITLHKMKRFEAAKASFEKALSINNEYGLAKNNLGTLLSEQGLFEEAFELFREAATANEPSSLAYSNLAQVLGKVRFSHFDRSLSHLLTQLLREEEFARPKTMAPGILSLLSQDPSMTDLFNNDLIPGNLKQALDAIEVLNEVPLLHELMRVAPLPDLRLEQSLVVIRRSLIENLERLQNTESLINFQTTLALHCFTNEYVYVESEAEEALLSALEISITLKISEGGQPKLMELLCLATYRALHEYPWCETADALNKVPELILRLVQQPLAEVVIAREIPCIGDITDTVSRAVQDQYEENPYPRWIKFARNSQKFTVSDLVCDTDLKLYRSEILKSRSPNILVAGCGTGQQSIETAAYFSDCHVTGVDLSSRSLAYATRVAKELCISNLRYLQADILNICQLSQDFDLIQCSGVLHHLDDPMAGWSALTTLLKSGGLFNIGLYSQAARRDVAKIRNEIASACVGTSKSEIRNFRQAVIHSHRQEYQRVHESPDFYSLSAVRDLLFHAQEHTFTIPQIKTCLDTLGLRFCGFENKDALLGFRKFHGEGADTYDLSLWELYETAEPFAFSAMYRFWCQKM